MMITVVFLILILITYIVVRFIHYFGKYKRIKAEHEEAENIYKAMMDEFREDEKEDEMAGVGMVMLVPDNYSRYTGKINYRYVKSMKAHGVEFEKHLELTKYPLYNFFVFDGKRCVNVCVERKRDINAIKFYLEKKTGLKVKMEDYIPFFFISVMMLINPRNKQNWYSRLFNESEKKLSEEIKSVWKTILGDRLLAPNLR